MKALDEFSHKDEISLLDFVKEFFKHVPDEIKKEIIDNEYKVMTNFSDVDFSCYEEFAKISSKELKISRKKIAADDEDAVKTCDLEFNGKINSEYKITTFWITYRLRRCAAVHVEAVVRRRKTWYCNYEIITGTIIRLQTVV